MFRLLSLLSLLVHVAALPFSRAQSKFSASVSPKGETILNLAKVELPPLPYSYTALEPYIGEQTLKIHHDKHHARYVDVTNQLIAGSEYEGKDVITILRGAYGKNQALFNNAAQSFNHEFYWKSIKPNGGGVPTGKIATLIDKYFGSYDKFRAEFINAGLTAFGSGW